MQKPSRHGARRRVRTVWISDVHLGFHAARADHLLEFLRGVECETLYLVGDIVDLWQIPVRKRAAGHAVEDAIFRVARQAGVLVTQVRTAYYDTVAANDLRHIEQQLARRE